MKIIIPAIVLFSMIAFQTGCSGGAANTANADTNANTAAVSPFAHITDPKAALDEAAARLDALGDDRDRITAAHAALTTDLDAATADDPDVYGERLHLHRHQGFVRVAFRLACWQLVHAPDVATGVIDVANRGGDADTNAAIVGALLGARDGLARLPRRWVERVHDARPADEALATRYHPHALVELLP